jgi:tRNA-dihydrouridine synthase C
MDAWIRPHKPALLLAPMEGITDAPMRALLTERPGFTHCVTEFLRISQSALPAKCYLRHSVELRQGSRTPGGIPVIFQLLGGHAERLALSAQRAVACGAAGIDLNFGCPAPTVNKHDGGATLLKFPARIEEIVSAVRAAVPKEVPVSAKLRLGWDDPGALRENAERAVRGGAAWIAVHGRTKMQGYTPPAYWEPIGALARALPVPVIANGEIWTLEDFRRCREETGVIHFMLGRGALANPLLPAQVAHELGLLPEAPPPFPAPEEWRALLRRFIAISEPLADNPAYSVRRIKQWLKFVALRSPFGDFESVKRVQSLPDFEELLPRLRFPTLSSENNSVQHAKDSPVLSSSIS